jgi:hypothetical protein
MDGRGKILGSLPQGERSDQGCCEKNYRMFGTKETYYLKGVHDGN